jgi:transcription elongation factor GreA
MERILLTPDGQRKLQEELDRLVKVDRPQNVQAIAEARAHGDLSENAEYHAAKERQSFMEGRIMELKDKLSRADVIDPSTLSHDRISFGATVTLMDIDSEEESVYTLVGTEEADVKEKKISITSPVGKALIGKEVGDEVTINAPGRTASYEIAEISYGG